jgi:hypothetical protein
MRTKIRFRTEAGLHQERLMISSTLAFALLDDGISGVFNSPMIIPVAGCVMILGIVATSIWAGVRSQEIKSHERLALLAQGIQPEPNWDQATVKAAAAGDIGGQWARTNDGSKARRAGIVLVSVGVGLILFFFALTVIVRAPEVLSGSAAGLIPLAIGVGFLVDARLKKREFEEYMDRGWLGGVPGADFQSQPVPPPPPAGMSPAQVSDWRPLH